MFTVIICIKLFTFYYKLKKIHNFSYIIINFGENNEYNSSTLGYNSQNII